MTRSLTQTTTHGRPVEGVSRAEPYPAKWYEYDKNWLPTTHL